MQTLIREFDVLGPWSLRVSRRSWEGFAPGATLTLRRGEEVSVLLRARFGTTLRTEVAEAQMKAMQEVIEYHCDWLMSTGKA